MGKYIFSGTATAIALVVSTFVFGQQDLIIPREVEPSLIHQKTNLQCVESSSRGSKSCKDAGNFDSTCAVAKCPDGFTLTGGGGSCAAGDRKLKALNPRHSTGEFFIMCEKQGVDPQARAICCK